MNPRHELSGAVPVFASLLLFSFATPAHAQWTRDGVRVCDAINIQSYPAIAADGSGGCFIAWQDYRGASIQIWAQHLDSDGNATWANNGVNVCSASLYQANALVVSDGAGGCIIEWSDARASFGSNYIGYAQRLDANGNLLWAAAGVPTSTSTVAQASVSIAADGAGGVLVLWKDARNGAGKYDPFIQRIDANGTLLWNAAGVDVCQHPVNLTTAPAMVPDGSGGAIVGWSDFRDGVKLQVFARRVDASGDTLWTGNGVPLIAGTTGQADVVMAADGLGGAFFGYDDGPVSTYRAHVHRLDGTGAVPAGWPAGGIDLGPYNGSQGWDAMVADGSGGAIMTFPHPQSGTGDITAAHVTAAGANDWTNNIKPPFYDNSTSRIVADGAGGVDVGWSTFNQDAYAIRLTSTGVAPGWVSSGDTLSAAAGAQNVKGICTDGAGGAIAVWEDGRNSGTTNTDIYAEKVLNSGVVGTLLALVDLTATPDRVALDWSGAANAAGEVSVQRRTTEGDWAAIANLEVDGRGMLHYEDRAVTPGTRYGYRLALLNSGGEQFFGETWVEVPLRTTLALAGARPNPTSGACFVAFSLPAAGEATLELFDLEGRRELSESVGELGAGDHLLRLDGGENLSPGVYVVRLSRAGEVRSARLAVVR